MPYNGACLLLTSALTFHMFPGYKNNETVWLQIAKMGLCGLVEDMLLSGSDVT